MNQRLIHSGVTKIILSILLLITGGCRPLWGQTGGITLSWDINTENDLAGYKVYYGSSSQLYEKNINVGLKAEYTFDDLTGMETIYVAITAYDTAGNESGYSSELLLEMGQAARQFKLGEAYPNPFNPSTNIPYFLPSAMEIDIRVYDILGREIAVLQKGLQPAGKQTAFWNGRNSNDRPAANGAYFIRLRVGQFSLTKRVLLIK